MSGTSVKVYFENEEERWTITKIAAQHDMTLPEYARLCLIKVTNDVLAERAEAQQALEAQNAEESAEPETGSATADQGGDQETEEVSEDTQASE